ncbi:MAG: hypothetical protein VX481_02920 [Cyanobacteriota bacterium]|nr:hypothetical protein [Cyanobacteriota bacterium]
MTCLYSDDVLIEIVGSLGLIAPIDHSDCAVSNCRLVALVSFDHRRPIDGWVRCDLVNVASTNSLIGAELNPCLSSLHGNDLVCKVFRQVASRGLAVGPIIAGSNHDDCRPIIGPDQAVASAVLLFSTCVLPDFCGCRKKLAFFRQERFFRTMIMTSGR